MACCEVDFSGLRIIIDLDDTLIMTMVKFNRASFECGKVIAESLGWYAPYAPDILALQGRLDIELMEKMGFCPEKYVETWLQTYDLLCGEQGMIPRKETFVLLKTLAMKAFQPPFQPVDGAVELLKYLVSAGSKPYLLTLGRRAIQLKKIESCGLSKFFEADRLYVVLKDKGPVMSEIAGEAPELTVMIGDSMKTDILKAVGLGINAIHIECPTKWSYNEQDMTSSTATQSFWRVSRISDVPEVLGRIVVGKKTARKTK